MPTKRKPIAKKSEDKPKIESSYKKNKELYWIIGVMVLFLLIILAIPYVSNSMRTFKYQNLTFTSERFGQIPVFHYYYYFTGDAGQQYKYNLYLRLDPRKNNVNITGDSIAFYKNTTTYMSINGTGLTTCQNASRDIGSLSSFLTNNFIKIKGATPDYNESVTNNITFANCSAFPNNPVIMIKSGEKTQINSNYNCYTIEVANCQLLSAVEKFEVQSIIDAKKGL